MTKHITKSKDTPRDLDLPASKAAFDKIEPNIRDLPADAVVVARADAMAVAVGVLGFCKALTDADRKRFASLATGGFETKHLDNLPTTAQAMIWALTQLETASATSSGLRVPVDVMQAATDVRERMLKLCSYHLDDDAELSLELADIRLGTGYLDTAQDLLRLSTICDNHKQELQADPKNYQADDVTNARKLADQIIDILSTQRTEAEKTWSDNVARVWTLLLRSYNEVRSAGQFLWRNETAEDRFPTLFVMGRAGRPRRKKDPTPPAPAPTPKPS